MSAYRSKVVVRKRNTNPKNASKKKLQSAEKVRGGRSDLLNEKGKDKEGGVRIIQKKFVLNFETKVYNMFASM